MKILILTDGLPPEGRGGAETVAWQSIRSLAASGAEVAVLTTKRDRTHEGVSVREGITIHTIYTDYHARWIAYRGLYNWATVPKVRALLKEVRPDVVHAHNVHRYLSYHSLKLAKQSGAKVFLTVHDVMPFHYGKLVEFTNPKDLSCPEQFNYKVTPFQQIKRFTKRYNPLRNLIIRRYLGYVDTLFAVSEALAEALRQNGIPNEQVLHNGIEVAEWAVSEDIRSQFIQKHNLKDKKVILFGGRLSEFKGGHQAFEAMRALVEKVPDAVLLIIGTTNAYSDELKALAKEWEVADRLVFTGWITGDELKAAYHAAQVVLVPSICFDSFPTVILEAMACRKPVVATCFGGAREMVVDGQTGYIVNPYNSSVMAERLTVLLNDSHTAVHMGNAGYERVQNKFSMQKSTAALLDKFREPVLR